MSKPTVYDIAGIGIGPFNLGLAALAAPIPSFQCIFFDSNPSFSWHPGMMLDFAKMQVPFYADLVTGAEPTNPYSFFSYLKHIKRLFQFAILEDTYISRKLYNEYCLWVARQLPHLFFGYTVVSVRYQDTAELYELVVEAKGIQTSFYARHIVIGIGSIPAWPAGIQLENKNNIIHSSAYVQNKVQLLQKESVTIVGSGQSAAEIFYDLLQDGGGKMKKLNWITKAARFHPMETSKFTLEMTSPDYIDHFFRLSPEQKRKTLAGQSFLYKGINQELLAAIYHLLYEQMDKKEKFRIMMNATLTEIQQVEGRCQLHFYHHELEQHFSFHSSALILATGYQPAIPHFLEGVKEKIEYNSAGQFIVNRNYSIDHNGNEIFVQNAELHSHGFNAPDLGMGPYRNAVILNTILGYDYFMIEEQIAFQSFGPEPLE